MRKNLSICSIFIWVDCLQMQGAYISLFKDNENENPISNLGSAKRFLNLEIQGDCLVLLNL